MEEPKQLEGSISFIGNPKMIATNLWSIGIKLAEDKEKWQNITEFGKDKAQAILSDAKVGDKVALTLKQTPQGYWNVKEIKFLERVQSQETLQIPVKTNVSEYDHLKSCAIDALEMIKKLEEEQIYIPVEPVIAYLLSKRK